ncbi:hypothetical protein M407DRAFT_74792, partial [Tulasnella calospora MUT 4182]
LTVVSKRFEKEIEILRKLKHPNIISLMAVVKKTERERAWLIFPWASHGNVKQFLKTGNWEIPERVALVSCGFFFRIGALLSVHSCRIIEDVSRGLSFLHTQNPPICHGDLKSVSLIWFCYSTGHLNHSIQSLISSMSSFAMHTASGPTWTTRWASPGILRGEKTRLTSDIWARGWVCWEIITDHMPFHQVSNDSNVVLRIIRGELPPVSSNKKSAQLRTMCTMLVGCWQKKPRRRPTATECLEVIEQLVRITAEHIESRLTPRFGNSHRLVRQK